MKSKREKGDEGEKFVADYLRNIGFVVQIHPRTFRIIYIKGKPIQISADNDYHSCFDLLAEGLEKMIYIQVKATQDRKITRDIARAKANIEKNYIYTFPYVRVQVWQVWREWIAGTPQKRRHKEYRFRMWERGEVEEVMIHSIHVLRHRWNEITPVQVEKVME